MAARQVTLPLERAECVAKFSLEISFVIAIAFSSVLAAGHGSMDRTSLLSAALSFSRVFL